MSEEHTRLATPRSPVSNATISANIGIASTQSAIPANPITLSNLPVVPGFSVNREIARGGMGVVYAAHDPTFDREVAVKVMHDGQDAGRFIIESKVTAQLSHPGIPPVYELGTLPDGRPFLAMKLIKGRTLADELKDATRDDFPRLLGAFEQICLTVGFAHSNGIIHRDLKPSNVMVGAFGEVLVMDWGLAKQVRGQQTGESENIAASIETQSGAFDAESVAGQVKGTPSYMAPEQARGEPVDARADVFALGGILAVMLTGKTPFRGTAVKDTVLKAAQANVAECFAALDECAVDVELISVTKKCLAPSASDRYSTGEEVAAAVVAYRAGVEERLRQAERDRAVAEARAKEEANTRREAEARAAEQRKKRKVQLALAVSIGLLLAGIGGVAWYLDHRTSEQKRKDELAEVDRKANEAELKGETAAERRIKAEQARQGVKDNLSLSVDLRKQYKFKTADLALVHAAELAKGAPELLTLVDQARTELVFAIRLDTIRYTKWSLGAAPVKEMAFNEGDFNTAAAPFDYLQAFKSQQLDLTALDTGEAARRIAASGIKAELVAAVDDWALYEPDPVLRDRLLEIARLADSGPWTDRLRTPAVRADKSAVAQLAHEAARGTSSTAALSVLAILMMRCGLDPAPMLSAARARYPTDFELAFALGLWYLDSLDGRQIGPYEAARALRPDNQPVWTNLGVALLVKGDADSALAVFREAILLDTHDAKARTNLGVALEAKGDVDGAIAAFKEAISANCGYAHAYYNLGRLLHSKRDVDGAVAAFKEAVRLAPKFAPARYNLARVLQDKGDTAGALAGYREAVQLAPGFAQAHHNLALIFYTQKKYGEAITSAQAAIRADPKFAASHAVLGGVLRDRGDLYGARVALTEAARLDKRWGPMLAKLPPLPVAPPPREVNR